MFKFLMQMMLPNVMTQIFGIIIKLIYQAMHHFLKITPVVLFIPVVNSQLVNSMYSVEQFQSVVVLIHIQMVAARFLDIRMIKS